jgi:putative ABC transport system substrate-binding protein
VIRRRIIALGTAAALVAAHSMLRAQTAKPPRVVWVGFGPLVAGDQVLQDPWHKGFRDLGYVEGRSISLEYRYVDAAPEGREEHLADLLAALVQQKVDVIFSVRPEVVQGAMRATRTIPIVFAAIGDPVGTGLVGSLARPGANVTGISYDASPELAAKHLQLLHELVPRGRSFGMIFWHSPDGEAFVRAAQTSATAMGVQLQAVEVREPGELSVAFASLAGQPIAGLIVIGSAYTWAHRDHLVALAAKRRLPAIYANRDSVIAGGLVSYGPVLADQFRRAAIYVDRILRGTRPDDLPVEQPTKFELIVNHRTARDLGIAFPQSLLLQVDEAIR